MMKCSTCQNEKAADDFDKKRNGAYKKTCRRCLVISAAYRAKNKEKAKAYMAAYRITKAAKVKAGHQRYRAEHREENAARAKAWRSIPGNKERHAASCLAWDRNQRATNPEFRIKAALRSRLHHAVRFGYKSAHTMELLGCTSAELMTKLEAKFTEGMTWELYGKGWHVDHIRPCASFNLLDASEQRICFHWSNLQPMWALENMAKGDEWLERVAFDGVMAELVAAH